MHVRVCRECGEEFRPEITVCSDCGGELADRFEDEDLGLAGLGREAGPTSEGAVDLGPMQVVASSDKAAELEQAAQALGAAGIRFVVKGSPYRFDLLVPEALRERALERLAAEEPADPGAQPPANCPACGASVAAGAVECRDCGLSLA